MSQLRFCPPCDRLRRAEIKTRIPSLNIRTRCSTCGIEKNPSTNPYCRVCSRQYDKMRYARNPDRRVTKLCAKCKIAKPPTHYPYCQQCEREYTLARYRNAPHQFLSINHRRRASLLNASGTYSCKEWEAIVKKQKMRCAHCGLKRKLTADHRVPISRGGCNFAFNIQALCRPCNSSKHNRITADFIPSLFDAP